jgi:hypothetical protein
MSFLAPALLAGLLAIVLPIVVHLVQRERRRVVAFPSLMFLRKIPNQSVKRRAIRHWPLLLLRVLAFVLLALAFARPFWPGPVGAATAGAGGREVVILLDRSHSMGYGDVWTRARDAAKRAVRDLGPADQGTVAFFASEVEVGLRAASERAALVAAIDRAKPGAGGTRYGPALRAAAGLLESSRLPRREIILISDFQKTGWDRAQDARLPPGVVLKTIAVGEASTANVAIVALAFAREGAAGGERVTTSARLVNRAAASADAREIVLEVDGHRVDAQRVSLAPNGIETVAFAPFTLGNRPARVTARLAPDALPIDDAFHAVVMAGGRVPILIIESTNPAPDSSLYLSRALAVGSAPGFDSTIVGVDRVTPEQVNAATVVIVNDTRPPSGAAGRALEARVRAGTGLLVALGERSGWPADAPDLLPGTLTGSIDRAGTRGGALGFVDYGHPVFEVFSAPRSGDLTAARVFRYRQFTPAGPVLARFDDGAAALVERRVGAGTVLAWTSTLDSYWNDFALRPVFVPFLHQAMKHLGHYVEAKPWHTVGEIFDLSEAPMVGAGGRDSGLPPSPNGLPAGYGVAGGTRDSRLRRFVGRPASARQAGFGIRDTRSGTMRDERPMVLTPAGNPLDISNSSRGSFELSEPGFYEVRTANQKAGEGAAVAVNVAAAESDLTCFAPAEFVAAVSAPGTAGASGAARELTAEDHERRQSLWWYLLAGGLLLLAIEAIVASRYPRIAQG